jgi:RNA polymerase sigma-70 factor (sigma-E family)
MPRAWEADFVAFYQGRGRALRRTAYLLSGNWHAAEDLVQTTFVKLYLAWPRIHAEGAEAYARRVLVRTYIAERRLRRSGEIPLAEPPDRAVPAADPSGGIDMRRALASLPRRQRAVVVLRYWEDMSVTETADLLGISDGTVKSTAYRAIATLRTLVGPDLEADAITGRT